MEVCSYGRRFQCIYLLCQLANDIVLFVKLLGKFTRDDLMAGYIHFQARMHFFDTVTVKLGLSILYLLIRYVLKQLIHLFFRINKFPQFLEAVT